MSLDFVLPYLDVWLLPQRPYLQNLCCMDINLTGSAFVLPVSNLFVPFIYYFFELGENPISLVFIKLASGLF